MNDKQQLAAMGEHMAERPICMAKLVDELTELLREVAPCVSFMINRIGDSDTLKHATQLAERIDEVLDGVNVVQPEAPEGWQVVPVGPTDHMTWVGQSMRYDPEISIGSIYCAMLAAAPSPDSAK